MRGIKLAIEVQFMILVNFINELANDKSVKV